MTVKEMTPDEKLDQLAMELSEVMLHLTLEYKGLEKDVAKFLARQLACYVAIVSKNPGAALEAVAETIRNHDFGATRAEHFGYTLGVHETQKPRIIRPGEP